VTLPSPFDQAAASYDTAFEGNPVTRKLRAAVWQALLSRFPPGSSVLELGCGTGTDALLLAEHGVRVTALDTSPGMLALARAKARARGLETMISFHERSFETIATFPRASFDGAFSNFGGLNCTPRLEDVIRHLGPLLRPASYLLLCLLNRNALWERASHLLRGQLPSAFRRARSGGVDAPVGKGRVLVWYYTLAECARMLPPDFRYLGGFGLSICAPPPNAEGFINRFPAFTDRLLRLEERIRARKPWNSLGDHFVLEAERRTD